MFMSDFDREITDLYSSIRKDIERRLESFREILDRFEPCEIFRELAFCILTPQSSAQLCWEDIRRLEEKELLKKGTAGAIAGEIRCARFHNNKAKCIVAARERFPLLLDRLKREKDPISLRNWCAENTPGLGYKEASHFLRNIGLGRDLAILDRHILRTLVKCGILNEMPRTLTGKRYLAIEAEMRRWSERLRMPLSQLDFVLWHRVKGELFK